MVATFNGNPSTTIISFYSPTNASDETDRITFYDELSCLVRSIPKHIFENMNETWRLKQQILLTQFVKQKWGKSNWILTFKWINVP